MTPELLANELLKVLRNHDMETASQAIAVLSAGLAVCAEEDTLGEISAERIIDRLCKKAKTLAKDARKQITY